MTARPEPDEVDHQRQILDLLHALNGIQTEFVATVRGSITNGVLYSGSFHLDAGGIWHKSFRVPYAFIYVACRAGPITVANQAPQTSPPPFGNGVFPTGGPMGWNIAGRDLTIYGQPGYVGLVEVDTKPQTPSIG